MRKKEGMTSMREKIIVPNWIEDETLATLRMVGEVISNDRKRFVRTQLH